MKTAISIPDQVFDAAESFARRLGLSRSELYSRAVDEYLNNHRNQGVTERLNKIHSEKINSLDDECYSLQSHSLDEGDW